ncbi:MAG: acetylxylan esterase [Bacteroidales bacterium]|nr:acetylxylan esterase [Bacteroidales bacterium]
MKRIFCIIIGLMAAVAAFGQSFLESIYLMPDKGLEAVYAKGETIKIYADADKETPALVKVYRNGQFEGVSEITLQAGRTEVFSGSYDEAAALMVRLANPQDQNDSTTVGAIVAPEEFLPGFDEPADFRDFWKKQLKTLRKQRMKVKLTPVEVPGEDAEKYVCYDLEINCLDFRPVRGYLAMPRKAKRRSLPIAIYAHSAGKLTSPYTRATVKKAVSLAKSGNGAIGLDINAHGMLNGQDEAYYAAMEEELHGYSGRTVTDHESFYFRGMFLRLVRALDYLCTRKEWDRKHVLVTGGSQGGAQSAALAGLDPRVTTVVVDVPAMWDSGGILKGRTSCWTKPLERDGIDSPAATIMPYYDACNFMRYFKGDLVVNVGLIDLTCPPASVWSVYNVCPARTKVIHPCAWKGHSGKYSVPTKEERNRIRKIMNKYIDDAIDAYLR